MRILVKFFTGDLRYANVDNKWKIPDFIQVAGIEVYCETSNGYYKCLKNITGDVYPLSPKEVTVWMLKATEISLKPF